MDIEKIRYLILAIQRQGERALTERFNELDITPSQAEALRVIQDNPLLSLKQLGQRLICEGGSPSRLLATLVDKGLVISQEDERDKRMKRLSLSVAGQEMAERIKVKEMTFYTEYAATLVGVDLETVVDSLVALVNDPQTLAALELRDIITTDKENM